MEPPVFQGRPKSIAFEYAGLMGKELSLISDPSKRPPNLTSQTQDVSSKFITKPAVIWYPWSRLSLTGGLQNTSALFVKAKVGLVGVYREDPEPGAFYMTLNLEGVYEQSKKSGDQNGLGGATGFPWEGTAQNLAGSAGLSIGYQLKRRFVPFIGMTYMQNQTSGTIKQSAASNGTSPEASYSIPLETGITRMVGIGLQWRPKNKFYFTPQVQWYELKWAGNQIQDIAGAIRLTYVPL